MSIDFTSIEAIRGALRDAPGPSTRAQGETTTREATLTKPPGSLGRLEDISAWLAAWQDRAPPKVENPQVIVFAGNHGIAARGVSAYPAEVTAQMVANFETGGAAVNQLSKTAGATFRVMPIKLEEPTADFSDAPAMDETAFIEAFNIGSNTVDPNCDLLCIGEMGIANTTSAAAVCHALFGDEAADWVGPGTGITGDTISLKTDLVRDAVQFHLNETSDPIDILRRLGGRELAAMAGAITRARHSKTPVLIDGYVVGAAAAAGLFSASPSSARSIESPLELCLLPPLGFSARTMGWPRISTSPRLAAPFMRSISSLALSAAVTAPITARVGHGEVGWLESGH